MRGTTGGFGLARRIFWRASLADHAWGFLFEPGPEGEVVALDCETTGLNARVDEIIAIAAVKLRGNRILTSERFEALVRPDTAPSATTIKVHTLRGADVAGAPPMHRVLPELLRFIGGRPLLGYYIDFDVRMLDRYVLRQIQTKLPNPRIEVSRLYYDRKYGDAPPGTAIDLRFATILENLHVPDLGQHDACNDAVMSAMMYLQLRDMQRRGVRLPHRRRASGQSAPPTGA
jgi:DNA polymerase III subunit epsilon